MCCWLSPISPSGWDRRAVDTVVGGARGVLFFKILNSYRCKKLRRQITHTGATTSHNIKQWIVLLASLATRLLSVSSIP
ncbi:unnamed protein product [Lactuca virosa]|uniref:Secreted protein n=1 Tax=Lactuca virosa TaxID=75947 RepID=A0AAU9NCL1_9ASTR|nr:unnamed protein product [Lactuca virosa]